MSLYTQQARPQEGSHIFFHIHITQEGFYSLCTTSKTKLIELTVKGRKLKVVGGEYSYSLAVCCQY